MKRLQMKAVSFQMILCAIGLLFWSCASGPRPTADLEEVVQRESKASREIQAINEKLLASVTAAPEYEDYVISEGDLLQVTVFEAEELTAEVRVGARGFVTLRLLGPVKVEGLTTREAEQMIEEAYRKNYLQDPHVSVFVKEQQGSKITLLGALEKPGTYDYFGRQRLMDVLAMAGGLTEEAGRSVQVRRAAGDPPRPETFIIDLDQMVNEGRSELNILIQGGDVIFVPEAGTVYVDGAVMKSGAYTIKQDMTVQQAIVAAGGLSPAASPGNLKLVRTTSEGKREVIQLSANKMSDNEIKVQDGDIVFVETNPVKAFMYGLRIQLFGTGVAITPVK